MDLHHSCFGYHFFWVSSVRRDSECFRKVVSRKKAACDAVVDTKIFSHSKSLGGPKDQRCFAAVGKLHLSDSRLFPMRDARYVYLHEGLILMVNVGKYSIRGSYGHQEFQVPKMPVAEQNIFGGLWGLGFPTSIQLTKGDASSILDTWNVCWYEQCPKFWLLAVYKESYYPV